MERVSEGGSEREDVREGDSSRGRGGYLERVNLLKYVENEREGGRERGELGRGGDRGRLRKR